MSTDTADRANFKPHAKPPMMTEAESQDWRPGLMGWSADILPFYASIALELPNPCTVVEVGSAHGRSAIFLAQELLKLGHGSQSRIFMVDDWGGGWFAECLPSIVKFAEPREFEMLRPLRCTSLDAAGMFAGMLRHARPHMVFIDGDHSRIGCTLDLAIWWNLRNEAGIFAGHDRDEVAHPGVVEAVDAFAATHGLTVETPTRSVWRLR